MVSPLYRKLTKELIKNGCYLKRQGKGSHEMWFSPLTNKAFPLPSSIEKTTTANAILKQAGVNKKI